ncbi:hypothetical protein Ac2012v2_006523 [Leucoagaricus gongylophorus]
MSEPLHAEAPCSIDMDVEAKWATSPKNPRNWSFGRKWVMAGVVSAYNFTPPFASSMMAPALPQIVDRYAIKNPTMAALTLSVFLLAFAFGPLLFGPLSEIYGRTWVLHGTSLSFCAFNIGCAFSPSANTLIAFRMLAGLVGSAPIACGGGSISDLFAERERASAMSLFFLGPLTFVARLGLLLGPSLEVSLRKRLDSNGSLL